MKFQRIWAITRKECIHIIRDWRSLLMALAIPIFLLVLFGYALTLDVDNVPLVVYDQSDTPESRRLISYFTGSKYFLLKDSSLASYKELEYAIDSSQAIMALVIPHDFSASIAADKPAKIQLIVDGSDSNTATIALGYAEHIIEKYSEQLIAEASRESGKKAYKQHALLQSRIWYNPDKDSKSNIVPSLIGVIMMVIAALLTSLTISREWERGTMEQLISTPVNKAELIIGKQLPYFFIGLIDVTIIILAGQAIFDVSPKGNIFFLYTMTTIFLIGALSLGILISIIARSQLVSTQMAMVLTFLPSFLLSGFISSISNMPEVVQYITYLVPARYLIYLLKAIYLKGVGLNQVLPEAAFLTAFGLGMFLCAYLKFKKKLI